MIFLRNSGKLCFATLREGGAGDTGTELQVMVSLASVGAESLAAFKSDVDLGDHLFVHGTVITSRRGELSVLADSWSIAAKALRPLPVAHKPLSEESRVRQRYVDLIVRPQARRTVEMRSVVNRSLRATLHERGYLEVETPMLQVLHGGAAARPFVTHMNAMDMDLYLRIAPELYLKRVVVGGIERVFEINRNFRNEGVDSSHSPEFAMLEAYEAYSDYNGMAELTQALVQQATDRRARVRPSRCMPTAPSSTSAARGRRSRCTGPCPRRWARRSRSQTPMADAGRAGRDRSASRSRRITARENLPRNCSTSWWSTPWSRRRSFGIIPVETSPLTRDHREMPGLTEKWDLYIRGIETATGYSELVDPVVQRAAFRRPGAFCRAG